MLAVSGLHFPDEVKDVDCRLCFHPGPLTLVPNVASTSLNIEAKMHAFLAKRMGLFCFAFTMTHTANKWVMSEAVWGEEKRHSQGQCVRRYAGKHLARLIMLSVRNERLVTVEIQEPLFQLPGHF